MILGIDDDSDSEDDDYDPEGVESSAESDDASVASGGSDESGAERSIKKQKVEILE